jgi:hypothetical protein
MWYYVRNNQRIGPVDDNTLATLIQNGTIVRQTLVWKEGMSNWQQAIASELAEKFSTAPPTPPSSGLTTYSESPVTFQPDSLRTLWLWLAWLVGIGTPLTFLLIGLPALIAGIVIGYILLYRFWLIIQDGKARTSPGKAVGFCFIPFFNLYWMYVAYVGLSKDMNLYCDERNIAGQRVSEGLALSYFILALTGIVPYIGILTSIAAMIIYIILMKQFVDTARGIMAFKSENAEKKR